MSHGTTKAQVVREDSPPKRGVTIQRTWGLDSTPNGDDHPIMLDWGYSRDPEPLGTWGEMGEDPAQWNQGRNG